MSDDETDLLTWFDADQWTQDPEDMAESAKLFKVVGSPEVELWLRQPYRYQHLIVQMPYPRVCFTWSDIRNRYIYPDKWLKENYPANAEYEVLLLGRAQVHRHNQDTIHDLNSPVERLPVWTYGSNPEVLLRYCRTFEKNGWSRIVVGFIPRGSSSQERAENMRVLEWLYRVNLSFPHVRMHLTFAETFRHLFGLNFHSVDFAPHYNTQFGKITLPNGVRVDARNAQKHLKWLHVLGFSVADVQERTGRIKFNIASAIWAAEHWNDTHGLVSTRGRPRTDPLGLLNDITPRTWKPPVRRLDQMFGMPKFDPDKFPQSSPDPDEPYHLAEPVKNAPMVPVRPRNPDDGDMIVCNSCSLAPTCRVYREGAICSVSGTPTANLAAMLHTRDVEAVKSALSAVLAKQAERYEASAVAMGDDVENIERSKHLMAMENSLARNLELFIRILDPKYRESNVPAISATVNHVYNPKVLVANLVRELEEKGVDVGRLDPDAVIEAARSLNMLPEGETHGANKQVIEG